MPSSSLQLMIVACRGQARTNDPGAVFGAAGGSIGCSTDNTLALPDSDGMVAQRHAVVSAHTDGWRLRNTSEHAAIAVNGKLVAPRGHVELHVGDIVNIGPYVLQAAVNAAPPAWHLPVGSGLSGSLNTASSADDASNLLYRMAPPPDHADDRPIDGASPSPLHDLLDTPLDPLALFGAPTPGGSGTRWSDAVWDDPAASNLFADLVAAKPPATFDASCADNVPGHAIRDDAPAFDSHLRLKIVPSTQAATLDEPASRETRSDAPPTGYGDAFGRLKDTSACVVRVTMPNYRVKLHTPVVPWHSKPITDDKPAPFRDPLLASNLRNNLLDAVCADSLPALFPPASEPFSAPPALAQAFLEGAGVVPGAAAEAGFTPEFMRTLGTLVRALKPQSS